MRNPHMASNAILIWLHVPPPTCEVALRQRSDEIVVRGPGMESGILMSGCFFIEFYCYCNICQGFPC